MQLVRAYAAKDIAALNIEALRRSGKLNEGPKWLEAKRQTEKRASARGVNSEAPRTELDGLDISEVRVRRTSLAEAGRKEFKLIARTAA